MKHRITIENYEEIKQQFDVLTERVTDTKERGLWENSTLRFREKVLWQIKRSSKVFNQEGRKRLDDIHPNAKLNDQNIEFLFSCFGKVKKLSLSELSLDDVWITKYTPNIEEFSCSENPLKNLDFLKSLTKLRKVFFINTNTNSLSPLSALLNLEEIYCGLNPIQSLEEVSQLEKLEILNCKGCKVQKKERRKFKEIHKMCKLNS